MSLRHIARTLTPLSRSNDYLEEKFQAFRRDLDAIEKNDEETRPENPRPYSHVAYPWQQEDYEAQLEADAERFEEDNLMETEAGKHEEDAHLEAVAGVQTGTNSPAMHTRSVEKLQAVVRRVLVQHVPIEEQGESVQALDDLAEIAKRAT
jgi:hypothetical protein